MHKKMNLLHAARGIFSILIVFSTAGQLGLEYWKFPRLGLFGSQVQSGGLAFFLMLSGFIIFSLYHPFIGDKKVSIIFFFKRMIRIYPIYWYILIAMIPFYPFFTGQRTDLDGIVKSIFLIPHDHSLLKTSWSLSYLLLFYTFFTVLLYFGKNGGTVFAALWFLGIVMHFTQPVLSGIPLTDFLFSKYHLYFFVGGFIGYLTKKIRFSYPSLFVFLGLSGLVAAVWNAKMRLVPLDEMYNFGIPVTVLLMGIVMLDERKQIRLPRFLNFLGQASYSVYLSHYPALVICFRLADIWKWAERFGKPEVFALIIFIALIVGFVTHLLIEKPLLSFIFYRKKIPVSSDSYLAKQ
jgi:peptidoglycan/LPS O-acetylase OafA/YrhL